MLRTTHKIGLARLMAASVLAGRRLLGRGREATVRRRGINWQLDLGEGIDFAIYLFGAFEPQTVRHYALQLKDGAVALDIGANIGAHTLPLARAVGPHGHVYGFEPTCFAFEKLGRNIALNPALAPRITAEQIALGEDSGAPAPEIAASWPLFDRAGRHALHGGRAVSTAGALADTLDAYVEAHGLARVDLIKLDVDGAECRVLRGARATLARFRPMLMLELAPYTFEGTADSLEILLELLRASGYRLRKTPTGAPLAMSVDALSPLLPPGHSLNAWAVPA